MVSRQLKIGIVLALIAGFFVIIAAIIPSSPVIPTDPLFTGIHSDTSTDGDYTITWSSSERSTYYVIQEDTDTTFTTPETIFTGSGTKIDIFGKSDGIYYYRIKACNKAGSSGWSAPRRIKVTRDYPSPPPPTTPTPTPLTITITDPSDGDQTPRSVMFKGTISGDLPDDQYMWVVVHPQVSAGWWPQTGRISPYGGKLYVQTWIGLDESVGEEFDILVVLANEDSNQYYEDYIERGKETENWPEISLPTGASIYDQITITRK
jgi:hypothetical protein